MKKSITMLAVVCLPLVIIIASYTPSVYANDGCSKEDYQYFNSLFNCDEWEHDDTSNVHRMGWYYDDCCYSNNRNADPLHGVALYTDVRDTIHAENPKEWEFTWIRLEPTDDGWYKGERETAIGTPYSYDSNHEAQDQIVEQVSVRRLDDNMQTVSGESSLPVRAPYVEIYYSAFKRTQVTRIPTPEEELILGSLELLVLTITRFIPLPPCLIAAPLLLVQQWVWEIISTYFPNIAEWIEEILVPLQYFKDQELTNFKRELLLIDDILCE